MWRSDYQLRPHEIDALGHLTATAYLALLEEARAAWLVKSLGTPHPPCVLRSQHIDYRSEITPADGTVTVTLAVLELGTTSVLISEGISAGGTIRAKSEAVLVMWDEQRRTARPMTEHERSSLAAFIPPDRRTSTREYASRESFREASAKG